MKVFVCQRRGLGKHLILTFDKTITAAEVRKILDGEDTDAAIRRLIARSTGLAHVPARHEKKMRAASKFTVSEKYVAEKLG
ncbi:MAG: hypothetical protein HYZ52_06345 [Candidatus Omnitrophica bacterium]|nr:hypothetical protein [Candidatus Omnitrophota bacterium]